MRGLDTNVLVRYLVQDDPGQAVRAARYIRNAMQANETCFINSIVLCELVWVLDAAYEFPKNVIVDVLEKLFMTRQIEIENKDIAWAALGDYRTGKAGFADCLIGRRNMAI
ncbi:MAG: type II toxin-antitoxin system VapC family toxin, partial [Nitrospirae bacterium]|nr:type II toxin-antitoxin system VapC family toxin [Nitrospirota bacterium]